jgi:hypothetical protein
MSKNVGFRILVLTGNPFGSGMLGDFMVNSMDNFCLHRIPFGSAVSISIFTISVSNFKPKTPLQTVVLFPQTTILNNHIIREES